MANETTELETDQQDEWSPVETYVPCVSCEWGAHGDEFEWPNCLDCGVYAVYKDDDMTDTKWHCMACYLSLEECEDWKAAGDTYVRIGQTHS